VSDGRSLADHGEILPPIRNAEVEPPGELDAVKAAAKLNIRAAQVTHKRSTSA